MSADRVTVEPAIEHELNVWVEIQAVPLKGARSAAIHPKIVNEAGGVLGKALNGWRLKVCPLTGHSKSRLLLFHSGRHEEPTPLAGAKLALRHQCKRLRSCVNSELLCGTRG
jgi:hypothetical protein